MMHMGTVKRSASGYVNTVHINTRMGSVSICPFRRDQDPTNAHMVYNATNTTPYAKSISPHILPCYIVCEGYCVCSCDGGG